MSVCHPHQPSPIYGILLAARGDRDMSTSLPLHFRGLWPPTDWVWVAFFLTNTLIFFILCIGHLAHNRHSTTPGSLYWMLLYLNTVQWIHRQADLFLNIPWDFAITFLVMSSSLTLKVTVITHLDSPPSCSLSVKFLFLSCNHFIVCVFLILEIQGIKLELCACQASLYSMLHYYLHKMKYCSV